MGLHRRPSSRHEKPSNGRGAKAANRLNSKAREGHLEAVKEHASKIELRKLKLDEARAAARKAFKGGTEALAFDVEEPEEPKARRYVVNDTTYEALRRDSCQQSRWGVGLSRRASLVAEDIGPRRVCGRSRYFPNRIGRHCQLHLRPHHAR